jgi:hypothetical protein
VSAPQPHDAPAAAEARAPELDEAALVDAFHAGALSPDGFDHSQHVRLARACLRRHPLPAVLAGFRRGLEAIAARAGKPGLYHETITWTFLLLVHERLARSGGEPRSGEAEGWAKFAADNTDLLDRPSSLLGRFYRPGTLDGELARRVFVFPDRV